MRIDRNINAKAEGTMDAAGFCAAATKTTKTP